MPETVTANLTAADQSLEFRAIRADIGVRGQNGYAGTVRIDRFMAGGWITEATETDGDLSIVIENANDMQCRIYVEAISAGDVECEVQIHPTTW